MTLLHRLAHAKGPDRELDALVAEALGLDMPADPVEWPAAFTASLDAVLRLLPEGWGVHMSMCENNTYKHPLVKLWRSYPVNRNVFGEADTLPIALLIAILRARGIE